jgi:hypothetical protein
MRHLTLLFTLLLATVALAATAKAAVPLGTGAPLAPLGSPALLDPEDAEEADEADDGEDEEAEACEPEDEEEGACEEDEGEDEGADECVLEDADAVVSANAGNGKVRVSLRYDASYPTSFTLDYSLRGGKGGLHLGSARVQLRRAGVFHDSVLVGRKGLSKLAAARQFVVELHAVGSPGYCRERLTSAAPRRASQKRRAGAKGRSGGPAPTRGS